MIFNKNDNGGEELRDILGFIDADSNFSKWKTWINLSVRQVTALTGTEVYAVADAHYNSTHYKYVAQENVTPTELTDPKLSEITEWKKLDELVAKFQLPNALFAYVRLLPSLDAGHSNSGRKKIVGSEERALTAVEAYKDETNILNLGYEALEDLLSYLEINAIPTWLTSETRKSTANLLVPTLEIFNEKFKIGSARLFYTLVPMLREVQDLQVVSVIKANRITEIIAAFAEKADDRTDAQKALITLTQDYIRRPMVLATMALALQRLPVELMPEGIVQTQVVGTVKEKLVANEQTRKALIQSLERDASIGFTALQEQIAILEGAVATERYVEAPKNNPDIKGFSF
jgi:hypothetical protein